MGRTCEECVKRSGKCDEGDAVLWGLDDLVLDLLVCYDHLIKANLTTDDRFYLLAVVGRRWSVVHRL